MFKMTMEWIEFYYMKTVKVDHSPTAKQQLGNDIGMLMGIPMLFSNVLNNMMNLVSDKTRSSWLGAGKRKESMIESPIIDNK